MASLSIHERYGKSQYTFSWSERVKWLKLLNRFHLFAANWKLNAFDIEKDAYTKVGFQTNASFTLDDLENCANATKYKISPTTSVTVLVHGNGFWGTMPAKDRIDWD
jgi:hypothetical protein